MILDVLYDDYYGYYTILYEQFHNAKLRTKRIYRSGYYGINKNREAIFSTGKRVYAYSVSPFGTIQRRLIKIYR